MNMNIILKGNLDFLLLFPCDWFLLKNAYKLQLEETVSLEFSTCVSDQRCLALS